MPWRWISMAFGLPLAQIVVPSSECDISLGSRTSPTFTEEHRCRRAALLMTHGVDVDNVSALTIHRRRSAVLVTEADVRGAGAHRGAARSHRAADTDPYQRS